MMRSEAKPRGLLARVRRLRWQDLALVMTALAEVLRTRLALTARRTPNIRSRIAASLQASKPVGASLSNPQDHRTAFAEVAWSVAAAARLVPRATCLTQAFSAQHLLARRGIASVVHLTVPKDASSGFRPHAWVMGDGIILLGGSARDYTAHTWLLDYMADGSTKGAGQKGATNAAGSGPPVP